MDVLRFFDTPCLVAEQVIDVPKIFLEDIPSRRMCREPRLAEQLVEEPTIVSFSWLQLSMEQNVDILVPGGGRLAGLQGVLPGHCSTAPTVAQIVDIPGGGLQGARPGQGSPASSSFHSPAGSDDDADEPGEGVFRTFPCPRKSVRVIPHLGSQLDSSSSEPSAHQMPRAGVAIDKLLMCTCDAVAGPLHVALLRNAWLNSEYMFCDSSWVRWPYCSFFSS